jgi:hypothetical protein
MAWNAGMSADKEGPPTWVQTRIREIPTQKSLLSLAIKSSDVQEVKRVTTATYRYLGILTRKKFKFLFSLRF